LTQFQGDIISEVGDPGWLSLLFRGHSRPARSFRHNIDCSADERQEIRQVTDTAEVTREH